MGAEATEIGSRPMRSKAFPESSSAIACCCPMRQIGCQKSREEFSTPPSPLTPSWPEGIFQGEGRGIVHFEVPATGIVYDPLFYTPHP